MGREERGEEREGRGNLSGNVAKEAFCLKSAPELTRSSSSSSRHL